jgi:hypothetical protein
MRPNEQTTAEMWRDFLTPRCARRGDSRRNDCDGNAMNGSLELSDHQLRQIQAAAKTLLPSQCSDFVHGVKRRKSCRLRSVPNWHSIACPPSRVQNLGATLSLSGAIGTKSGVEGNLQQGS